MSNPDKRAEAVRRLLDSRLNLGETDHRWDSYTPADLITEVQEELLDAVLYLEKLRETLSENQKSSPD